MSFRIICTTGSPARASVSWWALPFLYSVMVSVGTMISPVVLSPAILARRISPLDRIFAVAGHLEDVPVIAIRRLAPRLDGAGLELGAPWPSAERPRRLARRSASTAPRPQPRVRSAPLQRPYLSLVSWSPEPRDSASEILRPETQRPEPLRWETLSRRRQRPSGSAGPSARCRIVQVFARFCVHDDSTIEEGTSRGI